MNANSAIWTPTAHYGRQQHIMDANSKIRTPTHGFLRKFAKKSLERRKIREERHKMSKNSLPIDLCNSDSY
jgi:hypothetical protein